MVHLLFSINIPTTYGTAQAVWSSVHTHTQTPAIPDTKPPLLLIPSPQLSKSALHPIPVAQPGSLSLQALWRKTVKLLVGAQKPTVHR